jgi:hypothetical protein
MMATEICSALCTADEACSMLQIVEDFRMSNAEMSALGRENKVQKYFVRLIIARRGTSPRNN